MLHATYTYSACLKLITTDHLIHSLKCVVCTNKYKYCEYAGVEYSKQVAAQCPQHDYDHEEDNSFEYRKDEILSIMVCGDNQQPLCHMS